MTNDDLHVIACRILSYLYACMKAGDIPKMDEVSYNVLGIPQKYRNDIVPELRDNGYIKGVNEVKMMGGASGIKFFYINSHGGAEPCPFSSFSDVNVRNTSLREAMKSPLFTALRDGGFLEDDHDGGCVLFEKREQVDKLLKVKTIF